jgi:hypothetical protein
LPKEACSTFQPLVPDEFNSGQPGEFFYFPVKMRTGEPDLSSQFLDPEFRFLDFPV